VTNFREVQGERRSQPKSRQGRKPGGSTTVKGTLKESKTAKQGPKESSRRCGAYGKGDRLNRRKKKGGAEESTLQKVGTALAELDLRANGGS